MNMNMNMNSNSYPNHILLATVRRQSLDFQAVQTKYPHTNHIEVVFLTHFLQGIFHLLASEFHRELPMSCSHHHRDIQQVQMGEGRTEERISELSLLFLFDDFGLVGDRVFQFTKGEEGGYIDLK